MLYNQSLAVLLPLPFRRGEGRGEGFLFVVYPAVRCVFQILLPRRACLIYCIGG